VDITQELNVLNLKLQGPGQLITAVYESVKAFSTSCNCGKLSFLQKTSVISLYADLLSRRAQHSVVMNMLLLLTAEGI